jgi:hypothetical protein
MKKLLFSILSLLIFPLVLSAQLSIMPTGSWHTYVGNKEEPSYKGFNLKLALDWKARSQVGVSYAWHSPYQWQKTALFGTLETVTLPRKLDMAGNPKTREASILYTYFFYGDNVSFTSAYFSVGPGMMMRNANLPSKADPNASAVNKQTSYLLDTRVGASAHIGIGWLFLETRLANTVASTNEGTDLLRPRGPIFGVNTGLRFLLNRHPRCIN